MSGRLSILHVVLPACVLGAGYSAQGSHTAGDSGKVPTGVYELVGSEFVRTSGSVGTSLQWRLEALSVHGLSLSGVGSDIANAWLNGRLQRIYPMGQQVLVVPTGSTVRFYMQTGGGAGDSVEGSVYLRRIADYSANTWAPGAKYGKAVV